MSGHTVRIMVKQLGGGTVEELYYVAEPDAAKAEIRLRDALGLTNEDATVVAHLSAMEVKGLGLKPGGWLKAK